MKKSTTSQRLKQLMSARNLRQVDILDLAKPYCDRFDVKLTKTDLSQYVSGKTEPGQNKLYILANALNVSEPWLMGLDVPMERQEPTNIQAVISSDNIYNVPVFGSVSAGFGAYAEDEIIDYIPTVINHPHDAAETIAIKVTGDSMYPKIEDGDIIIVRKQDSVDSGSIAVLLLDGDEGLVKKVNYGPDWIELVSINPEYKPRLFEGEEVLRLQVVGLVKQVIKML